MHTATMDNVMNEELEQYFEQVGEMMGFPGLFSKFEQTGVDCDGFHIHMDILAHGADAPTVVFMPGTSLYALCYGEILYKLHLEGFNVVGFDPRGHGRSTGERGDYTIAELMDDARAVVNYAIERFGHDVSLMGSSQGGIVSFYLAAEGFPLRSVVCQNFADLTSPESARLTRFPRLSNVMKPLLRQFGKILPTTMIPIASYLDLDGIDVKNFGSVKKFIDNDPLALTSVSFRALSSLATTEIPRPVEQIEVPVMVLQGTTDSIFPVDYTRAIFDKLTCKKRFRLFEGKNHAIMVNDADLILQPIVEWLREVHEVK